MFNQSTMAISNALNIDQSIIQLIIAICFIIILTIFIYIRTANLLFASFVSTFGIVFTSIFGLTPFWIIPIFLFISMLLYYRWVCCSNIDIVESYQTYGDKLKLAYEAKFGYRNLEFDKEVDTHIKAVETLRKGYTRSIHFDKLKRLEKFVEAKK